MQVVFGSAPVHEAARRAAELGFAHIDVAVSAGDDVVDETDLALPVGDRIDGWELRPGLTCMAPPSRDTASFDRAVERLRRCPGVRVETVPGSVAGSVALARALVAAVPGLRLTVDTGHVATWGEDPVELLDLADHVQLRQAAPGRPQLHPDEAGAVDFGAVFERLDRIGYSGLVSIEYMDLPRFGFPLADPVGSATALAAQLR